MQPMPRLIEKKDCPRACQYGRSGDLAEVGLQQKVDALACAPSSVSALRAMPNNSTKQHRHQDFIVPFDSLFDSRVDDESRSRDEYERPCDRSPAAGDEAVERRRHLLGRAIVEAVQHRFLEKLERPAGDHAVERQNDESAENAHVAHPFPFRARGQFAERAHRVAFGRTAQTEFRQHDRNGNQKADRQIDQNEGRPAVLAGHVREAPDVAQSDNRASDGGDRAETARE